MYIIFLYFITLLVSMTGLIILKKIQLGLKTDFIHFLSLNVYNALFSSVIFLVISKFKVEVNGITLLYSFIFALIVFFNLCLGIVALQYITIIFKNIISNSVSIICTTLFGWFVLKEKFTFISLLVLIIMIIAIVFPSFGEKGKIEKKGVIICFFLAVAMASSYIITKLYTMEEKVCSSNSFFLLTNLMLLILCLSISIVYCKHKKTAFKDTMKLSKFQISIIGINTLLSNIGSIISLHILRSVPLYIHTIAMTALGFLASISVSLLIFKEKCTWQHIVSTVISLTAIFLMLL